MPATLAMYGTSHFRSFSSACYYYSMQEDDMELDELSDLVAAKLAEGSIAIGPPAINPGERLELIDDDTRYAIFTEK